MEFNKNGIITSSCAETFTPSCSKWKTEDEELLLADSDDQIFVGYKWNMPDERTLVLEKSGVTFTFGRIFKPQAASH
jgi:hypothetical protein